LIAENDKILSATNWKVAVLTGKMKAANEKNTAQEYYYFRKRQRTICHQTKERQKQNH
jgi:hypothetical protein